MQNYIWLIIMCNVLSALPMETRKRSRDSTTDLLLALNQPPQKRRALAALAAGADPNAHRPVLGLPSRPIIFDLIEQPTVELLEYALEHAQCNANPRWLGVTALRYAVNRACQKRTAQAYAMIDLILSHISTLENDDQQDLLVDIIGSFQKMNKRSQENLRERMVRGQIIWRMLFLGGRIGPSEEVNWYITVADQSIDPSMSSMVSDLRLRIGPGSNAHGLRYFGIDSQAVRTNNPWLPVRREPRCRVSRRCPAA